MGNLSLFLKSNKKQRENVKYAVTSSLCDEHGEPLEWVLRPLTTKENEDIRENCMYDEPVRGNKNAFRPKLNTKQFMVKRAVASVVEPNLYNAELQDSYGVKTPEELLLAMVDNPKEYYALSGFIEELNGGEDITDKIEQAKN